MEMWRTVISGGKNFRRVGQDGLCRARQTGLLLLPGLSDCRRRGAGGPETRGRAPSCRVADVAAGLRPGLMGLGLLSSSSRPPPASGTSLCLRWVAVAVSFAGVAREAGRPVTCRNTF